MSQKILDSTLENASFNIIFQIFVKCLTFVLNGFVLRYVTSAIVGVMNVRLLLLESTILFLSREAFRRAALSQTEAHSWPQIINLVWLTVPLSVILSIFFSFVWLHLLELPSEEITPHYSIGVWSVSFSCVIEMLSEPLYVASQAFSFTKLRIVLNSLVVFVRTTIFFGWILINSKQAVIAFSVAQNVANVVYTFGNTEIEKEKEKEKGDTGEPARFKQRQNSLLGFHEPFPFTSLLDLLPTSHEEQGWVHPNSAKLTWSFFKQGILKQILTDGEHYIMTLFAVLTFKEQGIYNVVHSLGSLIVRFLFRPVEDSLYYYFTLSVKRDAKIKNQNQDRMLEAAMVLSQSLNCITSVGLVFFIFGQSYSTLLLHIYGGETATSGEGPAMLRAYSFSVLLLGINGITECYAFSTMTPEQLNKYNYLMAIFSFSFLMISLGLTRLFGGVGFIFANCCIMAARAAHSVIFIKSKYSGTSFNPLARLIPNKYFLITLFFSFVTTKLSENHCQSLTHFFIGVVCFLIVIIVWCSQEQELVVLALNKWKNKKE